MDNLKKNKIVFIKLKSTCDRIQHFEDSYTQKEKRYYNFPKSRDASYLNKLTDDKYYYFFALVYENDENDNINYITTFLGTGTYSVKNNSLGIWTEYVSKDNNTTKNLRKLLHLDINNDFSAREYVAVEESEYLFDQIEFILNEPYTPYINNEPDYLPIGSESKLHPLAQKNEYCRRQFNVNAPQPGRGEFQRDYERIIHSKAFRRMVDKAQVFSASKGDYYRTRMTHSQVVAQIARGIAAELNLNLNLTEAIALSHDIGHTPFGHQGERTLNDILKDKIPIIKNCEMYKDHFGGFKHNYQSIRVASMLEEEYFEVDGMDLSYQTLEGMLKHTKLRRTEFDLGEFISTDEARSELKFDNDFCSTLEGQVVAISDEIAQRGHDLDDALSAGLLSKEEFGKFLTPKKMQDLKEAIDALGESFEKSKASHKMYSDENELMVGRIVSAVISYLINDVIETSRKNINEYDDDLVGRFEDDNFSVTEELICFSEAARTMNEYLETIISNKVINSPEVVMFDNNAEVIVSSLFRAYYNDPRLIHNGTKRRIYMETRRHTQNVVNFEFGNHEVIRDEIYMITKADLETLSPELKEEYRIKRRVLVRNICDFISGMTDTYAINEYKRIEK